MGPVRGFAQGAAPRAQVKHAAVMPGCRMQAGVLAAAALALGGLSTAAAEAPYPAPTEADFTLRDFRFASGESLAELRLHYRVLGAPRTDARGIVRNAVLILHGTGGSGASLV